MIGMLTGVVSLKDASSLILDVAGVGYRVVVPNDILLSKAKIGEELRLFTHTHVREDLLELYGFVSQEDLRLFEMLINVSGVGCKSAIGIFSVGDRSAIVNAVITGDVLFFSAVPRLGKKNSQKIIIELKNKIAKQSDDLDLSQGTEGSDEVLAALRQFGFSTQEAIDALRSLDGKGASVDEKLKLALKHLGR